MRASFLFQGRTGWTLLVVSWLGMNAIAYVVLANKSATIEGHVGPSVSANALAAYCAPAELEEFGNDSSNIRIHFRLMRPPSESEGERHPLVIFLHGAGRCGDDNKSQLVGFPEQMAEAEWRRRFPCYVLAPQRSETTPAKFWIDELERLVLLVCDKFPVDRKRVYLTGLSMGGGGAWRLAARRPELFAAVVPICGSGDVAAAAALKDVPIWAVHGDADNVVSVQYSREMIDAIRKAGGKPRYTELPGVGHDSWTSTYAEPDGVIAWMFRQVNDRVASR